VGIVDTSKLTALGGHGCFVMAGPNLLIEVLFFCKNIGVW